MSKLHSARNIFTTGSEFFRTFYHSRHPHRNTFLIKEVTEEFTPRELNRLGVSKSTGLDGLPARFIKDGTEFLKTPITLLINMSITTGTVPEEMKSAREKKSNPLDVNNYRPVSILSIVSKILERSIFFQLNEFLTKNNSLYEYQSGFRSRYSTDTCLIHLLDYIKGNNARGLYTGMIMLDLQKAFDTVDHSILCKKLEGMGVISIEWFQPYLSGRQQVVTIVPRFSYLWSSQGSILGSLLFLCYVNDMVTSVSADCKLILYADDSAIMFAHKNHKVKSQKLSNVMESCSNWLVDNKLSLHLGKTECILFGPRRKLRSITNFHVQYKDHILKV